MDFSWLDTHLCHYSHFTHANDRDFSDSMVHSLIRILAIITANKTDFAETLLACTLLMKGEKTSN